MNETITTEAPARGASEGDAEACNRPELTTTTSIAGTATHATPTLRDRNRMVVAWADQFDRKYREFCKTLGWRMDWQQEAVNIRITKLREHHRKNFPDISRRTVQRLLRDLERCEVVKRIEQFRDDGSQSSNRYVINFARIIKNGVGVYIGPPDEALSQFGNAVTVQVTPEPKPEAARERDYPRFANCAKCYEWAECQGKDGLCQVCQDRTAPEVPDASQSFAERHGLRRLKPAHAAYMTREGVK
jgi:hypothetical protein